MKLGITIYSNDAETAWNAFRFGNFALKEGDEVKIFLLGRGFEYQQASTDSYNIIEQADKYVKSGGKIFACETCVHARGLETSEICPLSSIKDLYDIVKESDRVISF